MIQPTQANIDAAWEAGNELLAHELEKRLSDLVHPHIKRWQRGELTVEQLILELRWISAGHENLETSVFEEQQKRDLARLQTDPFYQERAFNYPEFP